MRKIFYLVLFALGMTVSAQTLKMYKGEFPLRVYSGPGLENYDGKQIGYTEYEYKDAPDGSRIYEGSFHYTHNEKESDYYKKVVTGNFYNNKQVGKWEWCTKDRWYDQNKIAKIVYVSIIFDSNSVADGRFVIFSQNNGRHRYLYFRDISGVFTKGKITSLSYYSDKDKVTAKGKYSAFDLGTPIGKWTISGKDVPDGEVVLEFDNQGRFIKQPVYYDKSTGDKHYVSDWICNYPKEIYNRVINTVERHCYRDTEKPKFRKKDY